MNNIAEQIINRMMQSPKLQGNKMAHNAVEMYKKGNISEMNNLLNNLCSEKGLDIKDLENRVKNFLGMN